MATSVTKNPAVSSPADGNDYLYGYGGDDSMDDRGGNKYLYDAGDVVYEAAGGGTGTLILTGGNGVNSLAVDHTSDFLTEPGGAGSGSATIAATQEEIYVPAVAGENPAAIPGAAFNQAGSVQTNQLMVEAPASEGADNLASPLPTYSINEIADYIKEGFWDWSGSQHYRSFDMGTLGNNGVLYYNYSGFTDIAGAGTDTDGMTAARQALVDEALDYLGEILGINFLQTTDTDSKVDIFYKDNDSGAYSDTNLLIWGNLTDNHLYIDYSWVNVATSWDGGTSDINDYTYQTIIHETLHALGLGHAGPYNGTATYITDSTQATTNNNIYLNDSWQQAIMSYIDQTTNTTIDADYNFVITVMAGDMEALRDYYGYSAFTGDTRYGFFTNISAAVSQVMADLQLYADETAFCLIDDGGTDTVDFSGYGADQNINLAIASGSSTTGSISDIGGQIGNMTIAVGTVIENAIGGPGDDTITGNNADNMLSGGAGNDSLYGYAGNDTLGGGNGNNYLNGGTGNDTLDGWTGDDLLYGEDGDDYMLGYFGNDTMYGGAGNDFLYGEGDNDYLDGGDGNDTLDGGAGNDTYVVDSYFDQVHENGGGTDLVNAYVIYYLGYGVENLSLYGTATTGTGNELDNYINTFVFAPFYTLLSGLAGNDTLVGWDGEDHLNGGKGNDILYGEGDNDYLNGGAGNDTMYGGTGNDFYAVDSSLDVVTESAGEGTDQVNASINYTLGANVEDLSLLDGAATNGTGNALNNYIGGNSNANVLDGLSGNDYLDGGSGNDTMVGGTGDDLYVVDSLGDVVTESAGDVTDWVNAYINYTLGANVENLILYGPATSGTGNDLDNYISTTVFNNNYTLSGGAGNDALVGLGGSDVLDGGTGSDTMAGGYGDDIYYVDSAGDVVSEDANEGTDLVNAYVNYTLGANVENLNLYGPATSGTGNDLDNLMQGKVAAINYTLSGGAGNDALVGLGGSDVLDGGTGSDTMAGGFGNDTYYVDSAGDVVTEALNAGLDRVNAYINYTLGANVENLYLYGTTLNGTGNGLNNAIYGNNSGNTIAGLDGNDNLFGYGGNDTLLGGAGNDNLNGGTGNDAMTGGAGDDTYVVDSAGDVVTEAVGGGLDRVNAYVNYTLGAEVENLYLFSPATVGTGNGLNNAIYGNAAGESLFGLDGNDNLYGLGGTDTLLGGAGNDILTGGAGNDTMSGGAGNDLYIVDSAGDVAVEAAGEGTDRVNTYVNYTLSDNVENLYLFDAATNGTGNAQGNIIAGTGSANNLSGLSGNDTLYGYDGDDTLTGGAGADYLSGGNGQDRFILAESGLSHRDVIADLAHLNDSIVLKDIIDGASNSAINGLAFTGGVLNAAKYFEGAGFTGNGVQDSGIYNDTTFGNIYYNPTSGVAGDSVLICTVGAPTAASVDNTDFLYSA